jgi:hypothetical protein
MNVYPTGFERIGEEFELSALPQFPRRILFFIRM